MNFRVRQIIEETKLQLSLDLTDLTILTEVGTGNFLYTPFIAMIAGAKKVYAWSNDSAYGKGSDTIAKFNTIRKAWNLDESAVEFVVNQRNINHIKEADIVTNLGFVRPINGEFISSMKPGSVISYMCDAWEVREGDVDIAACKKYNIPLAGTWENHPYLRIFDFSGTLAIKLILEAGYEIRETHILIISSDEFGDVAEKELKLMGAKVQRKKSWELEAADLHGIEMIFIAEYSHTEPLPVTPDSMELCKSRNVGFVHLCGALPEFLYTELSIYPDVRGQAKRMTKTLGYLGPRPLIKLHTAGLKVGESLFRKSSCPFMQNMA